MALPPIRVSSASTNLPVPPIGAGTFGAMASRMRCAMNHADLYERPRLRCSWCADTPFFDDTIRCVANNHLCNGIWLRSYSVPTRTVNFWRQSEHQYQPGPMDLPPS